MSLHNISTKFEFVREFDVTGKPNPNSSENAMLIKKLFKVSKAVDDEVYEVTTYLVDRVMNSMTFINVQFMSASKLKRFEAEICGEFGSKVSVRGQIRAKSKISSLL